MLRNALRLAGGFLGLVEKLLDHLGDASDRLAQLVISWSRSPRKLDTRSAVLAGTFAIAIYLLPTIFAGLGKADFYRNYLTSYGQAMHVSSSAILDAASRDLVARRGGIFPLASLSLVPWLGRPSPHVLRALQFAAILINCATFAFVVARLSGSGALALLSLTCSGIALQLRIQDDPLVAPMFEAPLLVELALLAVWGSVSHGLSSQRRWICLAVAAALGAAFTNELGYAACLVVASLFLILGASKLRLIAAVIIGVIPVFSIAVGYSTGTPPQAIVRTVSALSDPRGAIQLFAKRSLAALPTSYRVGDNLVVEAVKPSDVDSRFVKFKPADSLGWLSALAFAILTIVSFVGLPENHDRLRYRAVLVVGFGFWLVPIFLPVGELRAETRPMYAPYDGIYIQTFGIGLLIALALHAGMRRAIRLSWEGSFVAGTGLLVFFVAYGNVRTNAFVLSRIREADAMRTGLERAARGGLFAFVPTGSTIVVREIAGFDAGTKGVRDIRFALYGLTGKRYATARSTVILPGGSLCASLEPHRCVPRRRDVFVVAASRTIAPFDTVTALRWQGSSDTGFETESGARFIHFTSPDTQIAALAREANRTQVSVNLTTRLERFDTLTSMKRRCGPVPARDAFIETTPTIEWSTGFYPPYPAEPMIVASRLPARTPHDNPWGYAGKTSHLVVHNVACHAGPIELTAQVATSEPATLDIRYLAVHRQYLTTQDGLPISLLLPAAPQQIDITFETTSKPTHDLYYGGRFSDAATRDIRLLVNKPQLHAAAAS